MRRTTYVDRVCYIRVKIVLYRWHGVPVFARMELGTLSPTRMPWHVAAACVAFQALSIAATVFHWEGIGHTAMIGATR